MNEYERRREERIARNRAVLERLIASDPAHAALHAATSKTTSRATPRVDSKLKKKTARRVDASDLRRSGRVRKLPAPVYTTFDVDDDLGDANATRKRVKMSETAAARKPSGTAAAARKSSAPPSANSLRALDARLWDVYVNYLGLPI